MIKVINTETDKEVILEAGNTLTVLLTLFEFDLTEGLDIRRLDDTSWKMDIEQVNMLRDAGVIKAGNLVDKTYFDEPDSLRYFINPLVAYYLYQLFHDDNEFITRDLGKEHTIHPLAFYNESYKQFWELNDLKLPVIPSNRIEEYSRGIEAVTPQISEYLRQNPRFQFEKMAN